MSTKRLDSDEKEYIDNLRVENEVLKRTLKELDHGDQTSEESAKRRYAEYMYRQEEEEYMRYQY